MDNGEAYMKGVNEGLIIGINILLDYADEVRADKKYQAANHLRAAANKLRQVADYKPYA